MIRKQARPHPKGARPPTSSGPRERVVTKQRVPVSRQVGQAVEGMLARRATLADILILAAIWLVFLLPFVVTDRSILQVDGHGIVPVGAYGYPEARQANFYNLDPDGAIGGDIAFNKYGADWLRRGVIPFWNPYQGLGQQFLGEGSSLVLYPINWLHLLLPVKDWDYVKFLHLFLAGCFFYLLAREFGVGRKYAILCGCCAYGAGFFQGFLAINTMAAGFVWTPLVLTGIERAFQTRRLGAGLMPSAIGTFFLATGCHPGFGVSIACVIAVYVGVRSVWEKDLMAPVRIALPVLIGLLCAAPYWMSFLQNALYARELLQLRIVRLEWKELPTMLLPQLYAPLYRDGAFGDASGFEGHYVTFGWIVPALTYCAIGGGLVAFREKNRAMILFAFITLWLWLWITGVKPFNVTSYIPILARTTAYYTMGVIQMLMCVLAAYGAAMLARNENTRTWMWLNAAWFALMGAMAAIAFHVYRGLTHPDPVITRGSTALALAGAVLPPALMWWGRKSNSVFLLMSTLLIAGGVAYFPSGAAENVALELRSLPLAVFLATAIAVAFIRPLKPWAKWAVIVCVLALVNVVRVGEFQGWPKRYDPYTAPAFVDYLVANSAFWRTYTTDGFVFPDLASGYPFSSINVLATLPPPASCHFFQLLDPYQGPGNVYGISSPQPGTNGAGVNPLLLRKRYWDYTGVRYVVAVNGHGFEGLGRLESPDLPMWKFQAVPLNHNIEFAVSPARPVEWVDLLVSTYARKNPGRLFFELKNAAGNIVISDTRDAASLLDNTYVRYSLEDGSALTPQVYKASVRFEPAAPGAMLAVWQDMKALDRYQHRMFARTGPFTQVLNDALAGAEVVRNETAEPILYVAPEAVRVSDYHEGQRRFSAASDLRRTAYMESESDPVCRGNTAFPSREHASEVSNIRVEPNRVLAHVNAKTGGTLTLVSGYSPGWSARINGVRAKVYRVNGVVQGACLEGPGRYDVEFSFEPPVWRASLASSAVGWLALLACAGMRRRWQIETPVGCKTDCTGDLGARRNALFR